MCGMPVGGLLTSSQGRAAALGGVAGGLLAGTGKKTAKPAAANGISNVQSAVAAPALGA